MASAASLIPDLKQGKELARPGYTSMLDTLCLEDNRVVYLRYFGESEWSKPEYFTLEDIATWTDDGEWYVNDEESPRDSQVKSASQFFKKT